MSEIQSDTLRGVTNDGSNLIVSTSAGKDPVVTVVNPSGKITDVPLGGRQIDTYFISLSPDGSRILVNDETPGEDRSVKVLTLTGETSLVIPGAFGATADWFGDTMVVNYSSPQHPNGFHAFFKLSTTNKYEITSSAPPPEQLQLNDFLTAERVKSKGGRYVVLGDGSPEGSKHLVRVQENYTDFRWYSAGKDKIIDLGVYSTLTYDDGRFVGLKPDPNAPYGNLAVVIEAGKFKPVEIPEEINISQVTFATGEHMILTRAVIVGTKMMRSYYRYGTLERITLTDLDDTSVVTTMTLPLEFSYAGIERVYKKPGNEEIFLQIESMTMSGAVYKVDTESGQISLHYQAKLSKEQIYLKDGCRIERTVARFKGIDGEDIVVPILQLLPNSILALSQMRWLVSSYGGYNEAALTPAARQFPLSWLLAGADSMGGHNVLIRVLLPGDGNGGKALYDAGLGAKMPNTYRALVAAAEHLTNIGYSAEEARFYSGSHGAVILLNAIAEAARTNSTVFTEARVALFSGPYDLEQLITIAGDYAEFYVSTYYDNDGKYLENNSPMYLLTQVNQLVLNRLLIIASETDRIVPIAHTLNLIAQIQIMIAKRRFIGDLFPLHIPNLGHYNGTPEARMAYILYHLLFMLN